MLLVVAAAAAVAVVLVTGDDEAAPAASKPEAVAAPAAAPAVAESDPGADRTLVLPGEGNRVVYVLPGEQAELHSSPGGPVLKTLGDETEFGSPHVFRVERVEGDWVGVPTPATDNGELAWLRLDGRALGAGTTPFAVDVDLSERRGTLLRNDRAVRVFTVSVGAPGTDTPTGRFAITDSFRGGLNPAYGCCAVALTAKQPNLPSGWLGGNRIAIHGTSGPLGEAISSGCVRAADRDVSAIIDHAPLGAPVTIHE